MRTGCLQPLDIGLSREALENLRCRPRKRRKRLSAEEAFAAGLCTSCRTRPLRPGRRRCPTCLEYARSYSAKQRPRRWRPNFRKYGLSTEEAHLLLLKGCRICGNTEEDRLVVDHNHVTGRFRGVLCRQCNLLLGMAREDCSILERAAEYLRN